MLLDSFKQRLQDERTATEENSVILQESLECLQCYLTVEKEVFVVQD